MSMSQVRVTITSPMHPATVAVHLMWGLVGVLIMAQLLSFPEIYILDVPRGWVIVWSTLTLFSSLAALWGAHQASQSTLDPTRFLMVEWVGCFVAVITQLIYLTAAILAVEWYFTAFMVVTGVLILTNGFRLFQISKDIHLIQEGKKVQRRLNF